MVLLSVVISKLVQLLWIWLIYRHYRAVCTVRSLRWKSLSDAAAAGIVSRENAILYKRLDFMGAPAETFSMQLRLFFGTCLLGPLKMLGLLFFCINHFFVCIILATLYPPPKYLDDPHYSYPGQEIFFAYCRWSIKKVLLLFGITSVRNHPAGTRRNLPKSRKEVSMTAIVSNHLSAIDILYFMGEALPSFVSKRVVAEYPVAGLSAILQRCIFVNRSNDDDRQQALHLLAKRMRLLRHNALHYSAEALIPRAEEAQQESFQERLFHESLSNVNRPGGAVSWQKPITPASPNLSARSTNSCGVFSTFIDNSFASAAMRRSEPTSTRDFPGRDFLGRDLNGQIRRRMSDSGGISKTVDAHGTHNQARWGTKADYRTDDNNNNLNDSLCMPPTKLCGVNNEVFKPLDMSNHSARRFEKAISQQQKRTYSSDFSFGDFFDISKWEAAVFTLLNDSKAWLKSKLEELVGLPVNTGHDHAVIPPLVVFPEGTTSSGRSMLPFKRGAFWALLPVQPVVLVYRCPGVNASFDVLPLFTWLFAFVAMPFASSLDAYWLQEVHPPPARPGQTHEERVFEFAAKVRSLMLQELKKRANWRVYDLDFPEAWSEALSGKRRVMDIILRRSSNHRST